MSHTGGRYASFKCGFAWKGAAMSFKCALCAEQHSHNVYYCSTHDWHLCWNCVKKATLTNRLSCPKCGHEVHRVD